MSGKTSIEWATRVWNPSVGCTRVSAGCDNCYAFALHDKRYAANLAEAARVMQRLGKPDAPRTSAMIAAARTAGGPMPYPRQYDLPFSRVQILEARLEDPIRWTKPERVFVDSMADLFHEDVPEDYIARVFNVMASRRCRRQTAEERRRGDDPECDGPEHQYLILTKRPERMRQIVEHMPFIAEQYFPGDAALPVMMEMGQWPLPNVWLGTSVEDQPAADERIPHLLATPAAVRFLSCEPLIGPVDLDGALSNCEWCGHHQRGRCAKCSCEGIGLDYQPAVDWVIVGGESGPRARPMDLALARSLVAQCRAAAVAVFVKQLGTTPVLISDDPFIAPVPVRLRDRKGGDMDEWPEDLRIREFPR